MKRLWIGIGLLALLLGAGLLTTWRMDRLGSPICDRLHRASQAALEQDWTEAKKLAEEAEALWQQNWHLSAALIDHTPMEEMDELYAKLRIYLDCRDPVPFAACCAQLETMTNATGEAHGFSWWNLLALLPGPGL